MTVKRRMLVLIDNSKGSMQTLQYIEQMSPFKKFRLVLFHVLNPIPECFWDMERIPQTQQVISHLMGWETRQLKRIESFTQNARHTLVDAGFAEQAVEIKIQKRQVGIARDIVKEAEDGDYGAVVLTRQGARAIDGIVVGSITNKLLAKITFCPLIIAGDQPANKRLLIAIDGSRTSLRAIDFVAEYAGRENYSLCLVHVIRGFDNLFTEYPELTMPNEIMEMAQENIKELFSNIKARLIKAGFEQDHIEEKIITGVHSRAETIVREAELGSYDTIVIGRKGLSRVKDFSMGRVCHKVIHTGSKFSIWVI